MSNSLWPLRLQPTRLFCPWDSPGKESGMGCHALLQGLFPTQGLNPCLLSFLHCRWILYHWTTGEAHLSIYLSSVYISESKWLNQVLQDPDIRFTSPPDSLPILSVHFFILHILDSVLNISHSFNFLYLTSWVPWGTWEVLPFPAVL